MSEQAEDTTRAALEAAFEAAEEVEEVEKAEEVEEVVEETAEVAEVEQEPEEEAAPAEEVVAEVTDEPEVKTEKPPAGWTPAAREEWAALPDTVKAQVAKREKEISDGLRTAAEKAKAGSEFEQVLEPYKEIMAVEGSTPVETMKSMAQVFGVLKRGSPQQKAQMLANVIKQEQVPIELLDSLLVGEAPAESQVAPEIATLIEQNKQLMEQFQQQQQQSQVSTASEIDKFAQTAEFFDDVINEMADIQEIAARRGQTMTLKESYDKACLMNPNVSQVLEQRRQSEALKKQTDDLAAKRTASSSLSGAPNGSGGDMGGGSIRDSLAAAWEAQSH
jgi:hypothetical protein